MFRNFFNKTKTYRSSKQIKQIKTDDSTLDSFQENNQKYQKQRNNKKRPIRILNFKSKYDGIINSNNITNNFYFLLVEITIAKENKTDPMTEQLLEDNKKIEDNKN